MEIPQNHHVHQLWSPPKTQIPNILVEIHTWPKRQSVGSITLMPSCPRTVAMWRRDATHAAHPIVSTGLIYLASFGWYCTWYGKCKGKYAILVHGYLWRSGVIIYMTPTLNNALEIHWNSSKSPCVLFGSLQNGSFNDSWWSELGLGFSDFAHQDYYIPTWTFTCHCCWGGGALQVFSHNL